MTVDQALSIMGKLHSFLREENERLQGMNTKEAVKYCEQKRVLLGEYQKVLTWLKESPEEIKALPTDERQKLIDATNVLDKVAQENESILGRVVQVNERFLKAISEVIHKNKKVDVPQYSALGRPEKNSPLMGGARVSLSLDQHL